MNKAEYLKNELTILMHMNDQTSNTKIQESAQYQEAYINYIGKIFNEAVQWYRKAPRSDQNFLKSQNLFKRVILNKEE